MEVLLSAVIGELTTRSINFLISRRPKPPALALEDGLHKALLRAQVVVDESMGRLITNQAMLQQLDMLRGTMYQGYYALDNFRNQFHDAEDDKDQAVSPSVSLSIVSGRSPQILGQLREALDRLTSMIRDVDVLVSFMMSYPRRYRQPYSMHLLLDNCMFGRQMETEHVINFLLRTQSYGAEVEVLPIVGHGRVGKSTLVTHVCKDERVRNHFSEIMFLNNHDFTDGEPAAFRHRCLMENHNCGSNSNRDVKFLVIVEVAGDFNEHAWDRFYSASKQWMPSGSKIIITSQTDKITRVGTTRSLTLKFLPLEVYWYFFKTLAFGSTDPRAHPRFANLAMEMARMMNGSFISAQIASRVMRDNFDIRFWCKVLALYKGFLEKHGSKFGGNPFATLNENRPALLGRMGGTSADLMVHPHFECSSQVEVPNITIPDVIFGSVKAHGKFEFAWTSPIPPYYSHIYIGEILELKSIAGKRKRKHHMENGVTFS
ncbi:hypothetical protein BS78_02G010500 [Paspalum vaginatum]|nr:hypothetical protein BS78_02G010500 [Paspalum vaginatum]